MKIHWARHWKVSLNKCWEYIIIDFLETDGIGRFWAVRHYVESSYIALGLEETRLLQLVRSYMTDVFLDYEFGGVSV